MAWTLDFEESKETIGTLVAYYDGEFVFKNSVNITDDGSVADFVATAKKIKASNPENEVKSKITEILTTIAGGMNK